MEVEGDVWSMFVFANKDKENTDLVYPPTDNLCLNKFKVGQHNRHRLSSSATLLPQQSPAGDMAGWVDAWKEAIRLTRERGAN